MPIESAFAAPVIVLEETTSTMDEARRLAADGLPPGSLVVTDWQSAGRGRTGRRRWQAPPGQSLLATFLAPPSWLGLGGLTLRVGLALALACEDFAVASWGRAPAIELKWPNDLMIGDRKLGGILCESGREGILVGFGINLAETGFPDELAATAISLALAIGAPAAPAHAWSAAPLPGASATATPGKAPAAAPLPGPASADAGPLGAESVRDLRAARDALATRCLARLAELPARPDWRAGIEARLWGRGRLVRISTGLPDAGPSIAARPLGLDDDGALLVEEPTVGRRRLHSAELSAIPSVDPEAADHLS